MKKDKTFFQIYLHKMSLFRQNILLEFHLGNTRLGIGDPTVLDALATAKLGDKTKSKLLEGAYNRTSDLGLIAKTLWEKGLRGVEKLEVRIGSSDTHRALRTFANPRKNNRENGKS